MYNYQNKKLNLKKHLQHLEVDKKHQYLFWKINKISKYLAFLYMVFGDKFRFKENINSWDRSEKIKFLSYENLCKNKTLILKDISKFLGISLPDFKIKKRNSSKENLPFLLQFLIKLEYEKFFKNIKKIITYNES